MATKANTQPVTTPAPCLSLYLKADGLKAERITKAKAEAVAAALTTSRVRRDALVAYVMGGDFTKAEAIAQAVIDNPIRRRAEHPEAGWVIPADCLGRAPKTGERDWQSTAQSVLLWMKRVFVDTGVLRISQISVVVEER